jgi:hypothetical protein
MVYLTNLREWKSVIVKIMDTNTIRPRPRPCETLRNTCFYGDESLVPRPTLS